MQTIGSLELEDKRKDGSGDTLQNADGSGVWLGKQYLMRT